ncbi:MAG: hypothetical protein KA210_00800 [Bacteroidia bacterium]|nr:hypothetical protein [Bacteroidia bacterium]
MKQLFTILKFYGYGFLISFVLMLAIHLYGHFVDCFYAFQNYSYSMESVFVMSFPFAFHLWIFHQLNYYDTFESRYFKSFLKVSASLWIGSFIIYILFSFIQVLGYFIYIPFLDCLTEDNMVCLSFYFGGLVGMLSWYSWLPKVYRI